MSLVNELIKEKSSLMKRIEAINVLLDVYATESRDENIPVKMPNLLVPKIGLFNENDIPKVDATNFPNNGKTENQILWLFNNAIHKGTKRGDVEKAFKDASGSDKRIDNVMRRLQREGALVVVKYNNQNKSSFWALPSWVNNDGFNEEYKPNEGELPYKIESIEVIR